MRDAAGHLSASLRDTHTALQWDELAQKPDSPDCSGGALSASVRRYCALAAEIKAEGRADRKAAPRRRAANK